MPLWRTKGKKWVFLIVGGFSQNHCLCWNLKGFIVIGFKNELWKRVPLWVPFDKDRLHQAAGGEEPCLRAGWQQDLGPSGFPLSADHGVSLISCRRSGFFLVSCYLGKCGSQAHRMLSHVSDSRNFPDSPLILSSKVWLSFWLEIIPYPCATISQRLY